MVQNTRQKLRFIRDFLCNLHVWAMHGSFVKEIITFPDLIVIAYWDYLSHWFCSFFDYLNLWDLSTKQQSNARYLFVDILSFEEKEFTNKPIFPMFFISLARDIETHYFFWRHVKNKRHGFLMAQFVYVGSYKELAIVN